MLTIFAMWESTLKRRIKDAHEALIWVVERSEVLSSDELRGLLSIEDYRGIVLSLGRALDLRPQVLWACEHTATGIAVLQSAFGRLTTRLWRHAGGHLVYALTPLLEPLILLRRYSVAIACSGTWLQLTLWRVEAWRRAALALSNIAFWIIVNVAVSPPAVSTLQWIHRRIWPGLVAAVSLVRSTASIAVLFCRLLAARGTILTVVRLTLALARQHRQFQSGPYGRVSANPEPLAKKRVASAILDGHAKVPAQSRGAELWVDVQPDGPLFSARPPTGIMALWHRIDSMSTIDRETYEEIVSMLQCPTSEVISEVIAAVKQIIRPPRPLLSAVMVATGLRMGLGSQLAKLRNPHLARESSRWRFFTRVACGHFPTRRYVILTPLNSYTHQKSRIEAGKLTARMLELFLCHPDGLSLHLVFALPVCRPNTREADERLQLAKLVQETLSAAYLPPGVTYDILDDLSTEVTLPNLKGLPLILALRRVCADRNRGDFLAISEMNESASWLNIPYLAEAVLPHGPAFVTGRRPMLGAGKPVAGHAATRLFNCLFRFVIPNVTARDSSSVLKVGTVASMQAIVEDLTCLDYSIDQDTLAMMAVRGRVIELPIEWYQARGKWGHEQPASEQIASIFELGRKTRLKRRLANLRDGEWLPLDAGFDFQALINDGGIILKGHAPERNRLVLLLTALRSVMKRNSTVEDGHREFASLVPLATRMIDIVGQGPLKALLRIAEGRYRDPLPAVREHMKYRVPAIVGTAFQWRPTIDTPIGRSNPFLFALEQPFATLGTLRSAMEWNLRFGNVVGAADSLRAILHLQKSLLSHGVLDPDMKSLLDCGIFVEDSGVTVKHLDFAGFLRDPYVIEAVLPHLMQKLQSMRDFRQIARCLGVASEGRARVVHFRNELEAFTNSVLRHLSCSTHPEFAPVPESYPPVPPATATRDIREELIDSVVATAKFGLHAPVAPLPLQILMREVAVPRTTPYSPEWQAVGFQLSSPAVSAPEPVFVVNRKEVEKALRDSMEKFLPDCNYEIKSPESPGAVSLVKLLRDANQLGKQVVMNLSGRSSRMQDLLGDGCILHKALMPVLGRPLFIHALEALRTPAAHYKERVWFIHPDTVCIWEGRAEWQNPEAEIVVSVPPEALRLLRAHRGVGATNGSRFHAAGKLFARYYLAMSTGGYSLPSLIGIRRNALESFANDDSHFGDMADSDFWGYISRVTDLPTRYRRGHAVTLMPQTWFDFDEPSQVMAFYHHALAPGFTHAFGALLQPGEPAWENCVSVSSKVETHDRVQFRDCVFDHSDVMFEVDPRLPEVSIEGLVVVNSKVRLRIAAPVVRDNLVYRVVTAPGQAVLLSLDGQAIAPSPQGGPCAVPLPLWAFSPDGHSNELLRCPGKSSPRRVEVSVSG